MVLEYDNLTVSSFSTLPCVPFLALKEKILGKKYNLSIAFVPPKVALGLNQEYRKKEYVPNTLSFSLDKENGEIVLCKSALRKDYKNFEMTYENYTVFILIHSMLHLKGMEHGGTMENKEKQLLSYFTQSTSLNETKHCSRR